MKAIATICICAPCLASAGVYNIDYGRPTEQRFGVGFAFNVQNEVGGLTGLDFRLSISHAHSSDLWIIFGVSRTIAGGVGTGANFQDTIISTRPIGPVIGSDNSDSPFLGPEWGGIRYRTQGDFSQLMGIDPNQHFFVAIFDLGTDETGFVYKNGDAAPWGTAIGTQLIIHTSVPEPSTWAALGPGLFAFLRSRRTKQ